jgi:hypothetical protein
LYTDGVYIAWRGGDAPRKSPGRNAASCNYYLHARAGQLLRITLCDANDLRDKSSSSTSHVGDENWSEFDHPQSRYFTLRRTSRPRTRWVRCGSPYSPTLRLPSLSIEQRLPRMDRTPRRRGNSNGIDATRRCDIHYTLHAKWPRHGIPHISDHESLDRVFLRRLQPPDWGASQDRGKPSRAVRHGRRRAERAGVRRSSRQRR